MNYISTWLKDLEVWKQIFIFVVGSLLLIVIIWIFKNYSKKVVCFIWNIIKCFFNSIIKLFSKVPSVFKSLLERFQIRITTISGSKEKIIALENRVAELEKVIKEFKKDKKRDFLRDNHYFQTLFRADDRDTFNAILKFQKEKGDYEIIPYLREFYKRISHPQFFDWWTKLKLNEKEREFQKIIDQVDSNWGEKIIKEEYPKNQSSSTKEKSNALPDTLVENTFTDPRDSRVYKTVKIGKQIWMAENLNYIPKGKEKNGNLYDWDTAMKASPSGWHLPGKEEWEELLNFAGGVANAGKKLKDEFGFATLPPYKNCYYSWWSTSENNSKVFFITLMGDNSIETGFDKRNSRNFARCIKDSEK